MHSEGILAGEMKHGPLALVDEHMPMIVLATQDRTCNKMHSVVQQLRARGANPLVVCNVGDDQIAGVCEGGEGRLIRVSSALPALPVFVTVAYTAQIASAYHQCTVNMYCQGFAIISLSALVWF